MLAQNFKSAEELGLTETNWKALIGVLGMLERGELVHGELNLKKTRDWNMRRSKDRLGKVSFNMQATYATSEDCGTVCCIAGAAEHFFGATFLNCDGGLEPNFRFYFSSIEKLFLPMFLEGKHSDWAKITTDQADTAIRNYLSTGEAQWEEVVK